MNFFPLTWFFCLEIILILKKEKRLSFNFQEFPDIVPFSNFIFTYINVCVPVYMYDTCVVWVTRGHLVPGSWSVRQLWTIWCRTKLESSERAVRAFNSWDILLAPWANSYILPSTLKDMFAVTQGKYDSLESSLLSLFVSSLCKIKRCLVEYNYFFCE